MKTDIQLTILLHAANFSLVLFGLCLVFSFQARSVFSHMAVQHLLKHYKCCDTALLAYKRVEAVRLRSGEPGTHTDFAISLLIFLEQGNESHGSGNHTAL